MTAPAQATASGRTTLSRGELRTLALAALGGALEFYDFIIFVFFTHTIGLLFFPPEMPDWLRQLQTLGLFAAGYFARPLGGVLMAHFGDRSGRKRMFTLSVLLMAVPTLLIGALPTWSSIGIAAPIALLLLRVLQGAAVGGEVPGAWTFVAEHVPPNRIGIACGVLTAGLTAGILLGSLVASALTSQLSTVQLLAFGWRIPFLIGGVFGLLAVFLRRLLAETPVFEDMRRRKLLATDTPLKIVLAGHARAVGLSMLLTWLLTAAIVVVILLTPIFLQSLFAITPARALEANSLATLSLSIGCVAFGALGDRIGAARSLLVGCFALAMSTYALYFGLREHPDALFALYAIAGFCVGVVGVIPNLLVTAFPAPIRFTGISFSYNIAYAIFGGLTPLLLSLAMKSMPMAPAHYVAILCAIGAAVALFGARGGPSRRVWEWP